MSAKKCVAVNCPYLGIVSNGAHKGKFVCRPSQEMGGTVEGVLVDEIIESGQLWNKSKDEKIQPCSEWTSQTCSDNHYKKMVRSLWREANYKKEMYENWTQK